jgi:tRNA modification GTPase
VLVGRPNAGKSSLFNALAGEARAIVSPLPGATRDYLTAELDLAGVAVRLIDTAGADPAAVGLASEAQRSRDEAIRLAQLELLCLDGSRPWHVWERAQLNDESHRPRLVLRTKCDVDLGDDAHSRLVEELSTSAATGAGLDELRAALRAAAVSHAAETDASTHTSARCGESIRLGAECLARAAELCERGSGQELIAAELRVALDELGKVAGAVYTDDLLDRIFSRFCIGK